ncbi:SRPBCC family protein [Spirillospora sp. NPDC048819]|uniref:SRPBCC family protein n=1 Tax=Spirillospora sp. NPDC048819 TaxID=3155268 RepID=UPI0033EC6326
MRIENTFTVPIPVDEAWAVLLDIERVAPCMPGATLESVDGDAFSGRVKAKVGPVTLTYKGRAEFTSRDPASHTATLTARGKDVRGAGTAAATVTMRLAAEGGATRVDVCSDLDITGRPAQLGRGVMTDVGNTIIGRFADALAEQITSERPAPAKDPAGSEDAIDLLGLAGGSLLRRILAALARPFRRSRAAQERTPS